MKALFFCLLCSVFCFSILFHLKVGDKRQMI